MVTKIFFSKNKYVGAVSFPEETVEKNSSFKIKMKMKIPGESDVESMDITKDELKIIKKSPANVTLSPNKEILIDGKKIKKSQ